MATLNLHNQINLDTVTVSGIFIDEYMPKANGEFVKIYLYLLRNWQRPNQTLSLSCMADVFHLTEQDVLRALSYWEKEGLLRLSFDFNHNLTDIILLDITSPAIPAVTVAPKTPAPSNTAAPSTQTETTISQPPLTPNPSMMETLSQDPSFCELLNVAEIYLKRTVQPMEQNILGYWYLMFECSYDIMEYLIEYCVEQGHTNMSYIETVARNWHEQHLFSIAAIKDYTTSRSKIVYSVMRAFGLQNRGPSLKETDFIRKWSRTFSVDMILKACEKTMTAVHNPSFEYTDSILTAWKQAGITTLEQVSARDKEYQTKQKQTPAAQPFGRVNRKPASQFHNFKQRATDYDELVANYYGYE